MLFIYVPVGILALIIAVKFFSLYEREICVALLCWMEGVAEKQRQRHLRARHIS